MRRSVIGCLAALVGANLILAACEQLRLPLPPDQAGGETDSSTIFPDGRVPDDGGDTADGDSGRVPLSCGTITAEGPVVQPTAVTGNPGPLDPVIELPVGTYDVLSQTYYKKDAAGPFPDGPVTGDPSSATSYRRETDGGFVHVQQTGGRPNIRSGVWLYDGGAFALVETCPGVGGGGSRPLDFFQAGPADAGVHPVCAVIPEDDPGALYFNAYCEEWKAR